MNEVHSNAGRPPLTDLKSEIASTIGQWMPDLLSLSHSVHARPEIAFEEHFACGLVADLLVRAGFDVEAGVGGLATAARARAGSGEMTLGFCAEYDALPGLGHACGHNIIAAASVGAAIGLAQVASRIDASVVLLGTPAEEGFGGKILMLDAGLFDDLHAAMMVHPAQRDAVDATPLAVSHLSVCYRGRASHAGAYPELGVNAADAFTVAQVAIGLLRQHLPPGVMVHGIITNGGDAPNVVPAEATGRWYVRAPTLTQLATAEARVRACFEAGASATGCTVQIEHESPPYSEFSNHAGLSASYRANAQLLGRRFDTGVPLGQARAATDMANVSLRIPAIHPFIGIDSGEAVNHDSEFARHCISPAADAAVADGAVALAWTALDAATDPALRAELLARKR